MRMQNMEKKLEELPERIGRCKQGLVALLSVDEDLHFVVDPALAEQGRRYLGLDEKYLSARKAVKRAFDEGAAACKRLDVPLDSPPDPLSSLEYGAQRHQQRALTLKEEVQRDINRPDTRFHEVDHESLAVKIKDALGLKKVQAEYKDHLKKAEEIRGAAKSVEELYFAAERALKEVDELLEALKPPERSYGL